MTSGWAGPLCYLLVEFVEETVSFQHVFKLSLARSRHVYGGGKPGPNIWLVLHCIWCLLDSPGEDTERSKTWRNNFGVHVPKVKEHKVHYLHLISEFPLHSRIRKGGDQEVGGQVVLSLDCYLKREMVQLVTLVKLSLTPQNCPVEYESLGPKRKTGKQIG